MSGPQRPFTWSPTRRCRPIVTLPAPISQSDPEQYRRSLTDLRDRYARDIKRLGYRNLPHDFEIEVTPGCPGEWFGHGYATLRQSDFDLELAQADKRTRGAIVRDYVVFFSGTGPIHHAEKGFELSVVYGKWTGDALVLRDVSGRCVSLEGAFQLDGLRSEEIRGQSRVSGLGIFRAPAQGAVCATSRFTSANIHSRNARIFGTLWRSCA